MVGYEIARLRIEDRIREADAERLARSALAGRPVRAKGSVRRFTAAVATAVLWSFKH